jgi:hypothetical protein
MNVCNKLECSSVVRKMELMADFKIKLKIKLEVELWIELTLTLMAVLTI